MASANKGRAFTLQVPATSANIGAGFDAMGVALHWHNTFTLCEYDGIDIRSADGVRIPTDDRNLVYQAARHLYQVCGAPFYGLRLMQTSPIPFARGLGSSSACLVGGLAGANALLGGPLPEQALLDLANEMEGHPDNIAPALLGGLAVCAVEHGKVRAVHVCVDPSIRFAALIPPAPLKTELARSVLPDTVRRADAVYNLSRAALLPAALHAGRLDLLRTAVGDRLHQQHRIGLIPDGERVMRAAYEAGAYGVYISGAGSTIMAIVGENGESFYDHMRKRLPARWQTRLLAVDNRGAQIKEIEEATVWH